MARLTRSVGHATRGLMYVLKHEANARIHLLFAIGVMVIGLVLQVATTGLAALMFAIILVFLAEIINTAFEKTLDLVEPNHHPQVKLVKDMAAGAVLVTAVAAVSIGAVIFTPYLVKLWLR